MPTFSKNVAALSVFLCLDKGVLLGRTRSLRVLGESLAVQGKCLLLLLLLRGQVSVVVVRSLQQADRQSSPSVSLANRVLLRYLSFGDLQGGLVVRSAYRRSRSQDLLQYNNEVSRAYYSVLAEYLKLFQGIVLAVDRIKYRTVYSNVCFGNRLFQYRSLYLALDSQRPLHLTPQRELYVQD